MLENNLNSNDPLKVTLDILGNEIDLKKLQMNHIWCNKITQEDLNTPILLDDTNQQLQLLNNLFHSIITLANHINDHFEYLMSSSEQIIEEKLEEFVYNSLIIKTSALIQKLKNFIEVKNKQFKKERHFIDPLNKLQKFYTFIRMNSKSNSSSKKVELFLNTISDFLSMLDSESHLK